MTRLDDVGVVGRAKGFDEGGGLLVVLVDFDAPEDLETGLVGVVHEEQGDARVVFEIAKTDVLLVAAKIREADEPGSMIRTKPLGPPRCCT